MSTTTSPIMTGAANSNNADAAEPKNRHQDQEQQRLSEKMQRMIEMQYEQMEYSNSSAHDLLEMETKQQQHTQQQDQPGGGEGKETHPPPRLSSGSRSITKTPYPSLRSLSGVGGTGGGRTASMMMNYMGQSPPSPSMVLSAHAAALRVHGSSNTPVSNGSPLSLSKTIDDKVRDPTVGQGTLYFKKKIAETEEGDEQQDSLLLQQPFLTTNIMTTGTTTRTEEEEEDEDSLLTPILSTTNSATASTSLGLTKSVAQHMHLSSYGSVNTTITNSPPPTLDPPRGAGATSILSTLQHPQQQQQQHLTTVPLHHDFYYGNPDYNAYHHSSSSRSNKPSASSRRRRGQRFCGACSFCCTCCRHCLRHCLVDPIVRACQRVLHAEGLHRSFCFGAIDGMLTGSGIVSTFCGLQLITQESHPSIHWLLVIFSLSACFADSVGMAIGHVWTTHVVHSQQAKERSMARLQFQTSKPDAKGQLVDLLLQKGMLKIDAMSLADTLEGYPDLFVSALAGESLVGGGHGGEAEHSAAAGGGGFQHPRNHQLHHHHVQDDGDPYYAAVATTPPSTDSNLSSASQLHLQRRHLSYGRMSDYDMDPESYNLSQVTNESRDESLWMMTAFTLFAVLPALILHAVWTWDTLSNDSNSNAATQPSNALYSLQGSTSKTVSSIDPSTASEDAAGFISPLSLAITIGACVMWTLGVWKSRFLLVTDVSGGGSSSGTNTHTHRSWTFAVFGFETVFVFGLCIASAYGLGALLKHLLNLPDFVLVEAASSSSKRTDDFW